MRVNKVNILKNIYTCVIPTDKKRKSVIYDMKTGKKEKEFDIVEEYEVYLVNNSDYPIEKVEMLVGGFASQDEEELLETSKNVKDFGKLDSKKALLLESLDFGMLDFMNWYHLDLHLSDKECLKIWFEFKYLQEKFFQKIPVLDKKGYNIEFDMRDTDLIKEEVKGMDMKSKVHKYD